MADACVQTTTFFGFYVADTKVQTTTFLVVLRGRHKSGNYHVLQDSREKLADFLAKTEAFPSEKLTFSDVGDLKKQNQVFVGVDMLLPDNTHFLKSQTLKCQSSYHGVSSHSYVFWQVLMTQINEVARQIWPYLSQSLWVLSFDFLKSEILFTHSLCVLWTIGFLSF